MNSDTEIDPTIAGEFSSHLLPDEQVLWTGQPGRRSSNKILPVIIGIAMLLFAAFWLHGTLPMFRDLGRAPGVFGYFPLIFLAAFLIMFIGPLVRVIGALGGVRSGRSQNTYYAVTNMRAMALSTARGNRLQSVEIASSPSIDKWTNREASGYVVVGDMQGSASSLAVASALGIDPPPPRSVPWYIALSALFGNCSTSSDGSFSVSDLFSCGSFRRRQIFPGRILGRC